jgi:hypothetical protein
MPRGRFPTPFSVIALISVPLLAGGCFDPYACRSSADAQVILADGREVASSRSAPGQFGLQAGDTTTIVSGVVEANACSWDMPPKYTSRERPERFTWSSSNPGVATVDSHGTIRGVAQGQASILVQARGAEAMYVIVDVISPVADIVLGPTAATVRAGDTLRFDAYLVDAAGEPIDFHWVYPYPVMFEPQPNQTHGVLNWIPDNRRQLLQQFPVAGTYVLNLKTVVKNVRRENAVVVTVVP